MLKPASILMAVCLIIGSVCQALPNVTPNYRVNYPIAAAYIDSTASWWGTGILAALGVPGYAIEPIAYNMFLYAFWTSSDGPVDIVYLWSLLSNYGLPASLGSTTDQIQKSVKALYNNRGIRILVSAFGDSNKPTSLDPTVVANNFGSFILQNNLDGADVDWEDSGAMEAGIGEAWLITFTTALRNKLPTHLITHAPQAPYFKQEFYKNGAYITVNKKVGSMIDLYLTQFYNQGDTTYDTYIKLFQMSGGVFSRTSVMEIVGRGVPANKIVIGKPAIPADATNSGVVSAADLAMFFSQGYDNYHWYGGLMIWQYFHDLDSSFGNTVLAKLKADCARDMNCF